MSRQRCAAIVVDESTRGEEGRASPRCSSAGCDQREYADTASYQLSSHVHRAHPARLVVSSRCSPCGAHLRSVGQRSSAAREKFQLASGRTFSVTSGARVIATRAGLTADALSTWPDSEQTIAMKCAGRRRVLSVAVLLAVATFSIAYRYRKSLDLAYRQPTPFRSRAVNEDARSGTTIVAAPVVGGVVADAPVASAPEVDSTPALLRTRARRCDVQIDDATLPPG